MDSKKKNSIIEKAVKAAKSMDRVQLVLVCAGTLAIAGILIYSIVSSLGAKPVQTEPDGQTVSGVAEPLPPVTAEGSSDDIIVKEEKNDTLACFGVYDDDGIAVMSKDGTLITDDIYYTVSDYVGEDDLLPVGDNKPEVSYIDYKTGEVVLKTEYAAASPFADGFAAVSIPNPGNAKYYIYGLIDKKGELIHKFDLMTAKTPSEGLSLVSPISSSLYGYMNGKGEYVIPAQFDNAGSFSEGLAPAAKDNKWGFINTKGEFVVKPAFDGVGAFTDGYAKVKVGELWGFIDKQGNYIAEPKFASCEDFKNGAAAVKYGELCGYINTKGQFIIEPQFEEAYSFSCGLASVKTNGKFGFIDVTGKLAVEAKYDSTFDFYEGIARVRDGKVYYYIDVKGNPICDKKFAEGTDFVSGTAVVSANGSYGIINRDGNYIVAPKYKKIKNVCFLEKK